jgi:hypothetical protein
MTRAVARSVQADRAEPSAVDTPQAVDAVIEELHEQIVEA